MSIVTLKRKARKANTTISGIGHNGFSLNGGHRNQGWVGQDSRGRYLSKTLFKGAEPIGHGGNLGKYEINVIKNDIGFVNDSNIIKSSSINTRNNIKFKKCTENCDNNNNIVKNYPYNEYSNTYNDMSQSTNINKIINNINFKANNNTDTGDYFDGVTIDNNVGTGAGRGGGPGATAKAGYKTNCNNCRTLHKSKSLLWKKIQPLSQNEYIKTYIKPTLNCTLNCD